MSSNQFLLTFNENTVTHTGRDFPRFFTNSLDYLSNNSMNNPEKPEKLDDHGIELLDDLMEYQDEFDSILKINKDVNEIKDKSLLYTNTIKEYIELNKDREVSFYEIRFLSRLTYQSLYNLSKSELKEFNLNNNSADYFIDLVNNSFSLLYLANFIDKRNRSLMTDKYEDYKICKPLMDAIRFVIKDDTSYRKLIPLDKEKKIKIVLNDIISMHESSSNNDVISSYNVHPVEIAIYKKHYNITNKSLLESKVLGGLSMKKELVKTMDIIEDWFNNDVERASKLESNVGLKGIQKDLGYKYLRSTNYIYPLSRKKYNWNKILKQSQYIDYALYQYINKYPDTGYLELNYITGLGSNVTRPYLVSNGIELKESNDEKFCKEIKRAYLMVSILEKLGFYTSANKAIKSTDMKITEYKFKKELEDISKCNDYYNIINENIDKNLYKRAIKVLKDGNKGITHSNLAFKCDIQPFWFYVWMTKHDTSLRAIKNSI